MIDYSTLLLLDLQVIHHFIDATYLRSKLLRSRSLFG
jgi:hypothetical protein